MATTRSKTITSFIDRVIKANAAGRFLHVKRTEKPGVGGMPGSISLSISSYATLEHASTLWAPSKDGNERKGADRVFIPGIYLAGRADDIATYINSPSSFATPEDRNTAIQWYNQCVATTFTPATWNSTQISPGFIEAVRSAENITWPVRGQGRTIADLFMEVKEQHDAAKRAAKVATKVKKDAKSAATPGLGSLKSLAMLLMDFKKAKKSKQLIVTGRNDTATMIPSASVGRRAATAVERLNKAITEGKYYNVNGNTAVGTGGRVSPNITKAAVRLSQNPNDPLHRAFFNSNSDPTKYASNRDGAAHFMFQYLAEIGTPQTREAILNYLNGLTAAAQAAAQAAPPSPKKARAGSAPPPIRVAPIGTVTPGATWRPPSPTPVRSASNPLGIPVGGNLVPPPFGGTMPRPPSPPALPAWTPLPPPPTGLAPPPTF